jgi:hypothetical protein
MADANLSTSTLHHYIDNTVEILISQAMVGLFGLAPVLFSYY